jgi:Ubiquitin carboxyl-terminal hydrolase
MTKTNKYLVCGACQFKEKIGDPDHLWFLGGALVDETSNCQTAGQLEPVEVEKAFENYLRGQLDGKPCNGCNKDDLMMMCSYIKQFPEVVFLQINRFCQDDKLMAPVRFDEILTLAEPPAESGSQGKVEYELYGVIFHIGDSIREGHYVAVLKGFDNKWRVFDDTWVDAIPFEEISRLQEDETTAYVFAYRRVRVATEPGKGCQDVPAADQDTQNGDCIPPKSPANPPDDAPKSNDIPSGTKVWVEGTMKIDARDLQGQIRQELTLSGDAVPLVQPLMSGSKGQLLEISIALRADDSGDILEGVLEGYVKLKGSKASKTRDSSWIRGKRRKDGPSKVLKKR